MTRYDQNAWFIAAFVKLLQYTMDHNIPVRGGEWHRPGLLAKAYSMGVDFVYKGVRFFWPKVGVEQSDHIYSLAVDIWITDSTGKDILWEDARYQILGSQWVGLGGYWSEKDPYHFEIKGKPV